MKACLFGEPLPFPGVTSPCSHAGKFASQRVQSTSMVQSMVSVVVTSLMVWLSIPYIGTKDPLGMLSFSEPNVAEADGGCFCVRRALARAPLPDAIRPEVD